jgi:hypothetical protein
MDKDINHCENICEPERPDCEEKAKINFRQCLRKIEEDMDLNGDGKIDKWDAIEWFFMRRLWDLTTPPMTPYPPRFGDEGPGSTDPRYGPKKPEDYYT